MGLSLWHLILLLAIVLLVFGPSRLGDLGKSLGDAVRGFKKGINEDPEIDVTDSAKREQLRDTDESKKQNTQSTHKEKV